MTITVPVSSCFIQFHQDVAVGIATYDHIARQLGIKPWLLEHFPTVSRVTGSWHRHENSCCVRKRMSTCHIRVKTCHEYQRCGIIHYKPTLRLKVFKNHWMTMKTIKWQWQWYTTNAFHSKRIKKQANSSCEGDGMWLAQHSASWPPSAPSPPSPPWRRSPCRRCPPVRAPAGPALGSAHQR